MVPNDYTILVVDDESTIRYVARRILEDKGFNVEEASGGEKCLEALKSLKPNLILLDIMMPDLTGWEVLDEIKKMEEPVPVIMLTVVKSPDEMDPNEFQGVLDYINKPFDEEDFLERVEQALLILGS